MSKQIKKDLHNSIPEKLTLNEEKKQTILAAAHRRMTSEPSQKNRRTAPVLAFIAVIGLAGFLAFPYLQPEREQSAAPEPQVVTHEQQVVMDHVEYSDLINSIYVDENDELIYTDGHDIFSYPMETLEETRLAEGTEDRISGVTLAADAQWISWESGGLIHILNRETGEMQDISEHFGMQQIADQSLLYLSTQKFPAVMQMDLRTKELYLLHEYDGEGNKQAFTANESKAVLSEQLSGQEGQYTKLTLYDLESRVQLGTYEIPYGEIGKVELADDRIYAEVSADGENYALGYISVSDGTFNELDAPRHFDYAVHGDWLALSVPDKTSDTVKVYKLEGDKAVIQPYLQDIKERLVRPRFTEQGTLVMNGEGAIRSMHLLHTETLK
ncbi:MULTISPECIES: hypothetical protein [unclassified Sporosarcina]|uniref:hypothetical protein n=1 Tax=unclassified Sporosarcina TaxID=2647733 RepID=UPI00203FC63A|nr:MULTISPECIES: hypothetical protein [unclassified Sporosarcina]GKV64055.1 hypothetical protein NCCP2331_02080 [Sporosarcina sp. NCCP-2331]GLB56370.1 hypothetical protein NCCP2378_21570 [Sporosarcina sp. NCCP-2378]